MPDPSVANPMIGVIGAAIGGFFSALATYIVQHKQYKSRFQELALDRVIRALDETEACLIRLQTRGGISDCDRLDLIAGLSWLPPSLQQTGLQAIRDPMNIDLSAVRNLHDNLIAYKQSFVKSQSSHKWRG